MASVTFAIPDKVKEDMESLPWVNWSELAREEVLKRAKLAKEFEEFRKIISKSKFTEKDADQLAERAKTAMHKQLKKEGLI
ncbi:MAG TPA: hypothetical protein VJI46_02585 [Candidatus Nanoarchaeia archaeon]|nr:hypothetical protein [Candidatus Nanoarchaeia archaeon]